MNGTNVGIAMRSGNFQRERQKNMSDPLSSKNQLNAWVANRYDELRAAGKHGHYETLFRVVQEALDGKWQPIETTDEPERYHAGDYLDPPDNDNP